MNRRFCSTCGTQVLARNPAYPDMISVRAGTLDDPKVFQPTFNLWLVSAQPWHAVDRTLASFETQPSE